MSDVRPLFAVGDRVAFDNAFDGPNLVYATVLEAREDPCNGPQYRVEWEDGFKDDPAAAWYGHEEFVGRA